MNCKPLPAALLLIGMIGAPLSAENTLNLPGMTPELPSIQALPVCESMPYEQKNCVRVRACVGDQGLWFDGQAHGWDAGEVLGVLSNGVPCVGKWTSRGLFVR